LPLLALRDSGMRNMPELGVALHEAGKGSIGFVWEPTVLIGLAILAGGYALVVGPLRRRNQWGEPVSMAQQAAFYAGTLAVFIALISPLDTLADEYLFSAHMAQHMLLTFVAPPLWLLGTPAWLAAKIIPAGVIRRGFEKLTYPVVAFIVFNGTMWGWHIPAAYDAALKSEYGLHVLEHVMFMATAVIGWWPALNRLPDASSRLAQPMKVMYLFAMTFPCTALAALITLSQTRLYPFYGDAALAFGLTPMADQVLGGLTMWLPGDMILVAAMIVILRQWLFAPSEGAAATTA